MEAKFMFRQWMIFGVLAAALALSPAFAFAQDQTSKQGSLAQTGTGGVQTVQVPDDEEDLEEGELPPAPGETADGMSTGGKVGLAIGGIVVIVGGALAIGGGGGGSGGGGGGAPPGS